MLKSSAKPRRGARDSRTALRIAENGPVARSIPNRHELNRIEVHAAGALQSWHYVGQVKMRVWYVLAAAVVIAIAAVSVRLFFPGLIPFWGSPYDVSAFPRVAPGQTIDFRAGKNKGALISGWGNPEAGGVWSVGKQAELGLMVEGKLGAGAKVSFQCGAFVSAKLPEQRIEVWSGSTKLADVILPAPENWFSLPLSRLNWSGDGPLILTFKTPMAASPQELGMSSDPRLLAFTLVSIRVDR